MEALNFTNVNIYIYILEGRVNHGEDHVNYYNMSIIDIRVVLRREKDIIFYNNYKINLCFCTITVFAIIKINNMKRLLFTPFFLAVLDLI